MHDSDCKTGTRTNDDTKVSTVHSGIVSSVIALSMPAEWISLDIARQNRAGRQTMGVWVIQQNACRTNSNKPLATNNLMKQTSTNPFTNSETTSMTITTIILNYQPARNQINYMFSRVLHGRSPWKIGSCNKLLLQDFLGFTVLPENCRSAVISSTWWLDWGAFIFGKHKPALPRCTPAHVVAFFDTQKNRHW